MEQYTDEQLLLLIKLITNNIFPRGMGNPIRRGASGYYIANCAEDVLDFIKLNDYKNVYITVYGFTEYINPKTDKDNAVIDKIPFDFDDANDVTQAHIDTLKWFSWCKRHHIKPTISYSGKKGFHGFININPIELQHPAQTIRKFVEGMNEEAHFNTLDPSVTGDLNRIIRVPGSIHKSTGRFCTALDPDKFEKLSMIDIIRMSKIPQDYIPIRVPAPYEIEAYLKQLDSEVAITEAIRMRKPQDMIQGSILSNIWNPDIARSSGIGNCIAFNKVINTGAVQGLHGDETLSGVIQKLRSDKVPEAEIYERVHAFNKLCKPQFNLSYLDYKIDYHIKNSYAPCTFFLKCGNLCDGCRRVNK